MGDLGMGKSTVLRHLHAEYSAKDDILTTLIPTPNFPTLFAMLKYICTEFGVDAKRSFQAQQEALQGFLINSYKEKRNVVLFIDEAQLLDNKALELLRSMLNFETHVHKLIQIVLGGQLELKARLQDEKNKALYSRISTYSLLDPMTPEEAFEMIDLRCKYVDVPNPFSKEQAERIYELTGGVPRSILKVCAIAFEMMKMSGGDSIESEYIESAPPEVAA